MKGTVAFLALVVVIGIFWFVWPTQYQYIVDNNKVFRIQRFSGCIEYERGGRWSTIVIEGYCSRFNIGFQEGLARERARQIKLSVGAKSLYFRYGGRDKIDNYVLIQKHIDEANYVESIVTNYTADASLPIKVTNKSSCTVDRLVMQMYDSLGKPRLHHRVYLDGSGILDLEPGGTLFTRVIISHEELFFDLRALEIEFIKPRNVASCFS